jgi:hypothetical protein
MKTVLLMVLLGLGSLTQAQSFQTQLCVASAAMDIAVRTEQKITGKPVTPGTPIGSFSPGAQAAAEVVKDKTSFIGALVYVHCEHAQK